VQAARGFLCAFHRGLSLSGVGRLWIRLFKEYRGRARCPRDGRPI
jgi:hypothetical protein